MNSPLTIEYIRKPETKTSFYCTSTQDYLPNRLSFNLGTSYSTRNQSEKQIVAQMDAKFKKDENGFYKINPPFRIHSNLYLANHEYILGYGDIGYTNSKGKTSGSKDLILVEYFNKSGLLRVHIYMGQLNEVNSILEDFESNYTTSNDL